jgi:ATP-dependent protease ClpP protease subunit
VTKRHPTTARVRTAAALKADARLLSGDRSRAARAEVAATQETTQEGGTVGELWLYGVVGGYWFGFNAESVSRALRGLDVDTLYVRIHSPGGSAADGIAIANLLRNHKANVVTVVDGIAASAASVIAIAGDQIVMCPGSQMMIHDASMATYGNAAQLQRDAEWIDKQSDNYAGVYALKAGGTAAVWREVMLANDGEGTWYTADDAVGAKLADEVGTRTATSSPPTTLEDQIDEDDDEVLARVEHDLRLLEQVVHPAARAAWTGAAALTPPTASAGGSITTHGTETAVTFTNEQLTTMRDKLGLPETADEAAILAAVEAVVDESLELRSANAGAEVPEGHVVIPAAQLETLTAGATAGAAAAATLHERDREACLDANRAKIPSKELRAAWSKQYDLDPKATVAALAALPDLVPVAELGHELETEASAEDLKQSPTYQVWRS